MEKIITTELVPTDSHKSFHGKARVISKGNIHVLQSYETVVCMINSTGNVVRLWGGYSATTMRHINAFLETFGKNGGGKAWWINQPVKNFNWTSFYFGRSA